MRKRTAATWGLMLALGCKDTANAPEQAARPAPAETTPAAPAPAAAPEPVPEPAAPAAPAHVAAPDPAAAQGGAELRVTASGTTMKFDPTHLQVKAGQPVHLVFEDKLPGTLPHNWVLVKPGTEASVAAAGLKKGAAEGFLDPVPDVLAYASMTAPGVSSEVRFTAPTVAGNYPYICTFPGHYMMMKGVLEVTP